MLYTKQFWQLQCDATAKSLQRRVTALTPLKREVIAIKVAL